MLFINAQIFINIAVPRALQIQKNKISYIRYKNIMATPKVRMLITHHEGAELPVNTQAYNKLFKPVYIPQNKYYESHIFKIPYEDLLAGDEEYVGHVTYSYKKKISPVDFETLVTKYKTQDYDIYALCPAPGLDIYEHADTWHKGFLEIWERLIALLGYKAYQQYPTPPAFFCNYWIMKKDAFIKYRGLALKAMEIMDSDPVLKDLCDRNSSYNGTHMKLETERLISISGKPYYTFHPFILERLICFVATVENMRIKLVDHLNEKTNQYMQSSNVESQPLYPFML